LAASEREEMKTMDWLVLAGMIPTIIIFAICFIGGVLFEE